MARSAVGVGAMREATIRLERADAGDGRRAQLRFVSVTVPEEPPERIGIAIRRDDAAAPWLGPHGWHASEHLFEPEEVWLEGDDLVLTVGPPVVDGISPSTVVDVQLVDLDLRGSVTWTNLPGRQPPAPPQVETAERPEPPAQPPVVHGGPAPAPVAPGAGKFAFRATPERRIALQPIGGSLDGGSRSLEPGEAIGSLRFTDLAQAFSGELEVSGDGEARITSRSPEGAPVHVHFRVEPDGRVILHRPTARRASRHSWPNGPRQQPCVRPPTGAARSRPAGQPHPRRRDARGEARRNEGAAAGALVATRVGQVVGRGSGRRRGAGRCGRKLCVPAMGIGDYRNPAETQPTAPIPTLQADRTPPATTARPEPPAEQEQAPPPALAEPLPPALEAPEPEAPADDPSSDGIAAPAPALPLPPPPTPEPPTPEPARTGAARPGGARTGAVRTSATRPGAARPGPAALAERRRRRWCAGARPGAARGSAAGAGASSLG
jgi:hypothetical protein